MTQALPHHIQRFAPQAGEKGRLWRSLLRSNRFVLTAAVITAIIIPEALHPLLAAQFAWIQLPHASAAEIVAASLALIAAHFSLQKVNGLPLVDDKIAIVPTFFVTYAINIVVIGFSVGIAGRYLFVMSFCIGTAWYYLVAVLRARTLAPRLAFAGASVEQSIDAIGDLLTAPIEWSLLREPHLPHDVLGIVFDKEQKVGEEYERLFSRAVLRGIPVYELSKLREMVTGRLQLRIRPEEEFGSLFPSQPYLRIKRMVDLSVAAILLPFALIVIAFIAILIRLESPGSAIYRQSRIGYRGRRFTCFKLRSMRSDCSGAHYTSVNDARITRIGRFIRKTRIDELPQIFNVILGDMSWIGPRPEALGLARRYARAIPFYGYRHQVRPGITGWAAVHQGNVALEDAASRKLEYDFFYIKHFSPWLDFLIVLMTIRTVLTGFGAR